MSTGLADRGDPLMEVPGTVKINNEITYMNEPGTSADGASPLPSPSLSSGRQAVENVAVINTGQKSDGRRPPLVRQKHVASTYSLNDSTEAKISPTTCPGPKSPAKKVPDVSDLPTNISKSRTIRFHKLFKSAPVEEYPIGAFSCAFKGDILLHGQMYVSHNWVCFYSKIKARGRLIEIPFDKIISITREKLALIIPNAIGIQTADQKYVFGSFMSRDSTYKKLVTIWKLNQDSMSVALGLDPSGGHSDNGDSTESDTTEDELDADEQLGRVLSASAHRKVEVEVTRHPEPGSGIRNQCLSCRNAVRTFFSCSLKLQKIPRTNMLLAICTILVFFLMLSAMGLTYKILVLQSRLEMRNVWSPRASVSFRDRAMSNMYWLQTESHASVVRQLHSVLEANVHLLEEVHLLLKSLYRDSSANTSHCSAGDK